MFALELIDLPGRWTTSESRFATWREFEGLDGPAPPDAQ
jgi:hypothetical protein